MSVNNWADELLFNISLKVKGEEKLIDTISEESDDGQGSLGEILQNGILGPRSYV
jgi:hypothetical protein